MRTVFLLVLIYFPIWHTTAQNHDNIWFFGYDSASTDTLFGGGAINFNTDPPSIYRQDKEMNFAATMVSACDSMGVLQFYGNGIELNDATHQVMLNGDSLNPGEEAESSAWLGYYLIQSEITIPMPSASNKFALFHLKIESHPVYILAITTFYMTVVDMSLNNGLGAVISKNEVLLSNGRFGTVNAVKHANGRDWWIWVSNARESIYHYFLLSSDGLHGPYEKTVNPYFCCPASTGKIVFSPDGTKAARYNIEHGVYFYDYDRCHGEFYNPVFIPLPNSGIGGGVAFSRNSRYFYIAHSASEIIQFDLWANNINSSKQIVAIYDGFLSQGWLPTAFFMLQLGLDGRIYVNCPGGVDYMHVITDPDKGGIECRVAQHSLKLPTFNNSTSPHYPNYRLGPLDGSPCDTLGLDNHPVAKFRCYQDTSDYLTVEFTDLSTYAPATWSWSFGDGAVSQDTSPVHSFSSGGSYEVCLTVSNQYSSDTFCKTLQLGPSATSEGKAPRAEVSLFPNPAREATNVRIGGDYLPREAVLRLHAATGQPVLTQRLTAGWGMVELGGLPPGIYFWEVQDGERPLGSGKLVVVE